MPPMKKSANVSRLKSLSRSKDSNFQRTNRALESAETGSPRTTRNSYGSAKESIDRGIREIPFDPWLENPNSRERVSGPLIKERSSSMKRTAQPMSSRQAIQILREHMKDLAKNGKEKGAAEIRKLIDKLTGQASIDRKVRRGGKINVGKGPTRRRAVRDRQLDDDTVDKFLRTHSGEPPRGTRGYEEVDDAGPEDYD